jgi:hypothetical protein
MAIELKEKTSLILVNSTWPGALCLAHQQPKVVGHDIA